MAAIAPYPLPPTPQPVTAHMPPPQASPPHQSIPPSSYGNSYNMSFDSQHGQSPAYSQSFPNGQQASFSNGPISATGYSRSFGGGRHPAQPQQRSYDYSQQIYTAVYSGVSVYEMEIHGVACMRRRSDGWLNATQILKVAGVDKGKRTKVLEKEILTGEHEKVQGGYGKYQGTWISYKRGREFCRQYGVEDILRPLLDYDVSSDGSGGQGGQQDTPTKEQAMAANRKRFYNTAVESQRSGPVSNGTFFQNISPTTSVALAAMNKAARLNSPAPRVGQRPDGFVSGSQQSMLSDGSFNADVKYDSGHSTQPNGEPPRKRMKPDSRDEMGPPGLPLDTSMRSATPTEPNESFYFDNTMPQELSNANGEPVALPPLPNPASEAQQERIGMILDLFAEAGRTDYSNHPALTQLTPEDLNMPLDSSANNALHWSATLAKVPLLKLLIQRGANIYRGNAAGQSPLISAVLVNNCWEHSCFPELLEALAPLIEVRDLQGRTILHHIAVSSGIKGRAPSSKYYLEALLEFLVRIGTGSGSTTGSAAQVAAAAVANMQANGDASGLSSQDSNAMQSGKGAVSLPRFLSHVVNARDKAGNTALNLVARIGNHSIIKQLLEIHADPLLPNYKGVTANDFGIAASGQSAVDAWRPVPAPSNTMTRSAVLAQDTNVDGDEAMILAGSQSEDLGQDVISSMTNMLTQSLSQHKDLLRARTEQIDLLNAQIREISTSQLREQEAVQQLKDSVRLRGERLARAAKLRQTIAEKRSRQQASQQSSASLDPPWLDLRACNIIMSEDAFEDEPNPLQRQLIATQLPSQQEMQVYVNAYRSHTASLQQQADELKARSGELEALYRKVVSLCTGVEEDKVEESLPALVQAVESEGTAIGAQEVGRVRDFLRRVDSGGDAMVES